MSSPLCLRTPGSTKEWARCMVPVFCLPGLALMSAQVRGRPSFDAHSTLVHRVYFVEEGYQRAREEAALPGDDVQEQQRTHREDPVWSTMSTGGFPGLSVPLHRFNLHGASGSVSSSLPHNIRGEQTSRSRSLKVHRHRQRILAGAHKSLPRHPF